MSLKSSYNVNSGPLHSLSIQSSDVINNNIIALACSSTIKIVNTINNNNKFDINELSTLSPGLRLSNSNNQNNFTITDVEFNSIDKSKLAIATTTGNLLVTNIESNNNKNIYWETNDLTRSINKISWNQYSSNILAIACQDGTIRLYDHRQNGKAFSIHDSKSDTARDVHYSPLEEHLLAAVFDNGSWSAWDSRISGRPLVKVSGHTSNGYSISWHHSKEGYLATGSRDKTVKIWNMNTIIPQANQIELGGQLKPEVTINTPNSVGRVNWRPDHINTINNQIATTSCLERGDIDIWETNSSNVPAIVVQDRKDACSDFEWFYNESNNYMVSVGRDGWMLLHDITGGHQPRSRVSPCVSTISSRGHVVYYRGQRDSNQGDIFTGLAGITNLSEANTIRSLSKQQRAEGSVFDPAMIGLLAKNYQTGWENVCNDYHSQALSACIHNKSIALAAGLNCRAAVWSIAITLLSDCDSTFIFSIDILGDLLRELLEGGDCIHFVVLSEVFRRGAHVLYTNACNKNNITDVRKRETYLSYLELLSRHQLMSQAALLINASDDSYISKAYSANVVIHTACSICSKEVVINGGGNTWCSKCNRCVGLCAVCQRPVKGLIRICPVCFHGGHNDCMIKWFSSCVNCPAGCEHDCCSSLINKV